MNDYMKQTWPERGQIYTPLPHSPRHLMENKMLREKVLLEIDREKDGSERAIPAPSMYISNVA